MDKINHPSHYTYSEIEPINVIEAWNLGFCLGNAIKYIARAEYKGTELEDLKKAAWYLARRIAQVEAFESRVRACVESDGYDSVAAKAWDDMHPLAAPVLDDSGEPINPPPLSSGSLRAAVDNVLVMKNYGDDEQLNYAFDTLANVLQRTVEQRRDSHEPVHSNLDAESLGLEDTQRIATFKFTHSGRDCEQHGTVVHWRKISGTGDCSDWTCSECTTEPEDHKSYVGSFQNI